MRKVATRRNLGAKWSRAQLHPILSHRTRTLRTAVLHTKRVPDGRQRVVHPWVNGAALGGFVGGVGGFIGHQVPLHPGFGVAQFDSLAQHHGELEYAPHLSHDPWHPHPQRVGFGGGGSGHHMPSQNCSQLLFALPQYVVLLS